MMHITSVGITCMSIPRSTSSRPNRLHTSSAFTIGSLMSAIPP